MRSCSVVLYMSNDCNKFTHSKTVVVKYLESFERDELELIFWRSSLTVLNINATICHHHEETVLRRFSSLQKTCFDSFKVHKKSC